MTVDWKKWGGLTRFSDNHFTRQYNPEDSSEHHTRRRENLKSHTFRLVLVWVAVTLFPSACLDLLRLVKRVVTVDWSRLKGKGTVIVVVLFNSLFNISFSNALLNWHRNIF
jgi:hypothetical protein